MLVFDLTLEVLTWGLSADLKISQHFIQILNHFHRQKSQDLNSWSKYEIKQIQVLIVALKKNGLCLILLDLPLCHPHPPPPLQKKKNHNQYVDVGRDITTAK